jgi:cytochrome c biogenesis protein CcmG/thiol:disulfide interchange protein DsbE
LAGRTLAGDHFDLAGRRGQVTLVNVFASWCGPCRDELPLLVDAQRRWSAQGLRVVGLNVRDGPDAARALLQESGAASLTVVPDARGAVAVEWGVRGVPETFLVDRDGRIRQWAQGPITAEWLEKWLPPLLAP